MNSLDVNTIRKLNYIGGRLEDVTITLQSNSYIYNCVMDILKKKFQSNDVHYLYAKRVAIGFEFSSNHRHYKTNNLMLNDIKNGKKIFIKSYL